VAERLETADAARVVGDGAVADSTVVVVGTSVEDVALGGTSEILLTRGWQTFP